MCLASLVSLVSSALSTLLLVSGRALSNSIILPLHTTECPCGGFCMRRAVQPLQPGVYGLAFPAFSFLRAPVRAPTFVVAIRRAQLDQHTPPCLSYSFLRLRATKDRSALHGTRPAAPLIAFLRSYGVSHRRRQSSCRVTPNLPNTCALSFVLFLFVATSGGTICMRMTNTLFFLCSLIFRPVALCWM